MEKMISFPEKRVRDLGGLYLTLQKAGYAVRNIGADGFGTYVYLEETEQKDPVAFIDEWVSKPAPNPNDMKAFTARKADTKLAEEAAALARATEEAAKIAAQAAEKAAAEAAVAEASGERLLPFLTEEPAAAAAPAPVETTVTSEPGTKESLLTRIIRTLW